jgi:tripartite ATP-independent transporter DctM subunit
MATLAIAFFVLLALGLPISVSMGMATLAFLVFDSGITPSVLVETSVSASGNFILTAIPFFILAGHLMNEGGITVRLVNFSKALVGHFRGGLAQVNVLTNMIMAGVSGSAAADCAAVGAVMVPAMKREGYKMPFAASLTAAASSIGPIIPPSIPMVIYGSVANVSVGKLLLAGVLPGILLGLALMGFVAIYARRRNLPRSDRATGKVLFKSMLDGSLALLMPLIIMGGILGGRFTPTEAAAVAAVYSLLIGKFVYKQLTFAHLPKVLYDTARTTGVVMIIVAMASSVAWVLTTQQAARALSDALLTISADPLMFLLLVNVLLLIVGMFLETASAIIVFTPILLPIAVQMGVDPVHFGIIVVLNLTIGLMTPPVGICLYIVCSISRLPLETIVRAVLPFLAVCVAVLLLVTYFDQIALFLPELLK